MTGPTLSYSFDEPPKEPFPSVGFSFQELLDGIVAAGMRKVSLNKLSIALRAGPHDCDTPDP
jgi:hypothetical protein